jgi:hypothetical protein
MTIFNSRPNRKATPKFNCKKISRPQTKYTRQRQVESTGDESQASSSYSNGLEMRMNTCVKKGVKPKQDAFHTKNSGFSSEMSTDCGYGSCEGIDKIIDKLQDPEW